MTELETRIKSGDIILLDGGTGTEIERRGVDMDSVAWCGAANRDHADIIREVHTDYIRAGADVIIANAFSTACHVLEPAGLGHQCRALNTTAIEVARQARETTADRPVWVAASMLSTPPLGHMELPGGAAARAAYREQAEAVADAGADLIIAEMITLADNATIVVEEAGRTGLPVWVGLSAERHPDDGHIIPWGALRTPEHVDDELGGTIEAVSGLPGVDVVGVMHTRLDHMEAALTLLAM